MSQFVILYLASILLAVTITSARSDSGNEFYYGNLYRDAAPNFEELPNRDVDGIGGSNLLRDLTLLRNRANYIANKQRRNLDPLTGGTFGQNKRYDVFPSWNAYAISPKRNMDEMDRAGFSSFIKKKNFDEIDRSGFDGFVKRNFDEMDRAGFGSFVKRDLTYQQPSTSSANNLQSSTSGLVPSSGSSQNHK